MPCLRCRCCRCAACPCHRCTAAATAAAVTGAGWCEPGHFCGYESTTTEPSRCLPLPKDCGKAGQPCCPSNTDSPHTSLEDKMGRKPYCKDGSTCFYFAPVPGLNNGDMYAGNKGAVGGWEGVGRPLHTVYSITQHKKWRMLPLVCQSVPLNV
jgi:hypothetical protein